MKIETKQLIGVVIGVALGYGINQIPGLSSGTKMWLTMACVLALLSAAKISAKSK